jgi:hypothetical protein
MGQKRRRLALSCVACRKRKVKCGRELPRCVRCVKGSQECKYVPYEGRDGTLPTPTEESPEDNRDQSEESWTEEAETYYRSSKGIPAKGHAHKRPAQQTSIEELHDRVTELRSYVMTAGARPMSSQVLNGMTWPESAALAPKHSQDFDRSLLRGKSFKTQYSGPTNAASLLLQFAELSQFVRDIIQRLPEFETTKHMRRGRPPRPTWQSESQEWNLQTFVAMLPAKERCDALLEEYLTIFETTYRVLHVPMFKALYEEFWTSPDKTNITFIVQLLLVMAAMNCVVPSPNQGFIGRNLATRETAHRWIEMVEFWLSRQSHKHTTLEYFQTHVLLIIAKRVTLHKIVNLHFCPRKYPRSTRK